MSSRVMNLAHLRPRMRAGMATAPVSSGATILDLARDRRGRLGIGGGTCRARHRQGRPHPRPFQELRRDVLLDVRGLPIGRGLGADQFPPDAGRGRVSRHRLRRESVSVPRRFPRSCDSRGGGEPGARLHVADRRGRAWAKNPSARRSLLNPARRSRTPRSTTTIPAGSSSPPAPPGAPRPPC